METFIIPKSSPKIIEDILDILKGNKIDLENKKQENEKGSKMEDQISNIKSSQIKVNNQEPNIKTVLSYKQVTEKNLVYPISRQMNETNQIANTPRNSIGSINSKPKQKKKDQISNIKPPQIQVNTQESNIKRVLSYKQVTEKNLVYPISKQMNETNQIANTPRNSFDSVNSKPKQKKKSVKITTNISNSDLKTGKSPITSVHGDSNKHTENIRATPSCKNIDNLVSVDKNIEINLGEKSSEHALIISAMPQTHSVDSRECILTCRQSSQCRVSTTIEHGGKKVMEQNKSTVCSKDIKNGKTSMNPSYEEDLDKNTSPSGSIHYTGENNVKSETENRMKSSSIYRIMPVIAGNPVRLMQYTNLKIISSLNILQYSITNFESKFSSATAKTVKDYLKILNCFEELNISMHSIFSGRERQEIQKFCEAISRVCLANSYAYILSQIYNFIESQKLGPSGKDNLFNELVKMLIKFHSSVEIYEKFKYRNDDLYMEIAKTVCPIVPITHIPFSNSKILESIAALRKFQIKKTVSASLLAARDTIKRIKHKQDLYNVLMISKFSEFDNLYFNVSKVAELLTLQREMCRRLSHPPKILFQYIKTFFEVLKKLEEEKYELQITSHVIKFLYCMDVIISEHILGILLSHFYSVFLSAYSMLFKNYWIPHLLFIPKCLTFLKKNVQ
ncbi:hypothetical protein HHI36_002520 [Cryptolaemus montrouzieri]|uniref:Uncharacterized protein n=1 Tax=Cryptolaemus montrouzieri TaxID=559131 RepID=A0ABD2PB76_9CUCU